MSPSEPMVLHLLGHVPAKKNNWRPRKGGGIVLDRDTREAIDRLAMQIPGRFRDLRLESPEIEFYFTYMRGGWDRDNAATTLLDVLVEYGVLYDDNIKRGNGKITIHPALPADSDGVTIVIIPAAQDSAPVQRYVQPRRRKRGTEPGLIQECVREGYASLEDFEDFAEEF